MFQFLRYVRPAWYYRLHPVAPRPLYGREDILDGVSAGLLSPDAAYRTLEGRESDLLFQAIRVGLVPQRSQAGQLFRPREVDDVNDNYRFIRKYHSTLWYVATLLIRLLSLCNPFREVSAFMRGLRASRPASLSGKPDFNDFPAFAERLDVHGEKVSVIIPTLNRYTYLMDVFKDLERQTYRNFEVVVCDQSDAFDPGLYEGWGFPLKVLRQGEKALWLARNSCIRESDGDLVLLFDDDSRVGPDWIRMHVACLSYFGCDISAGVTDTLVGNGLSERDGRFHYSEVFDTGNALLRRKVFGFTGLFDRQFEKQRMGDGEFGLRCFLSGFPSVSNPHAIRTHLKVEVGGLREFGSWDAFRPGRLFSPRPVPSVLYLVRRYFGNRSALHFVLNAIVLSVIPYRYKNNRLLKLLSPFVFLPMAPLIVMQVVRSWRLSTEKIRQGPMVEPLSGLEDTMLVDHMTANGRWASPHNG